MILQHQGDYEGRGSSTRNPSKFQKKLGDLKGMASSYGQLIMIRQAQGDYDGCHQLWQKSLEIFEKLGDLKGIASSYHQLGTIRQHQGDYEGACSSTRNLSRFQKNWAT